MNATASIQNPIELQYDMLIDDIKKGLLVPVLGGDINLCGRPLEENTLVPWSKDVNGIKFPPSTCELASHLLNEAKGQKKLERDLKELLSRLTTQLRSPQDSMSEICLANVCQYIQFVNPDILDGLLPKILAEEYSPTPVHEFLVKLAQYQPNPAIADTRPYPCIVTTCFDQVLEQQLRKNQVPFHLVAFVLAENGGVFQYTPPGGQPEEFSQEISSADVSELMEGFKEHPVIIKLNGGIPAGRRNFSITEDHYIDYLSHQGIKDSLPEMLLAKLTKRGRKENSHLLFLGYSLRHWNLRVILRRIWSECLSNQNKRWTVILERRFSCMDTKFWAEYGLQGPDLKQIDSLDTYITRLTERLASLPVSSQPNLRRPILVSMRGRVATFPKTQRRDGIFISYSRADKNLFDELVKMLTPVQRELKIWHDRMIQPGTQWRQEIERALASAKAAVLLVSPEFLSSDFIQKYELPPLLNAAKANGCQILWIKLKESLVNATAIEEYQALYHEPISSLTKAERNVAFYKIAKKIQEIFKTS